MKKEKLTLIQTSKEFHAGKWQKVGFWADSKGNVKLVAPYRKMLIAKRTSDGWRAKREANFNPEQCDECGAGLHIGPTGPFCDAVHLSVIKK